MRAYIALFRIRARVLFGYRLAAIAGLFTQWVFGFLMISVLVAFYNEGDGGSSMTLAQTISYTWIGQAVLGIIPWNIDRETGQSIRTGEVAYDLTRPLSMYMHWFVRAVALRTIPTVLRCVPMFVIATYLMPPDIAMRWPSAMQLAAFSISLCGAVLLSAAMTVLMQSTLFWTVTGDGVTRIVPNIVVIFAGLNIPLPLFPDSVQRLLALQPFASVFSSPALLFTANIAARELPSVLALQIIWLVVFVLLGRAVLRRGLRKLTVAGG